MYPHETRIYIAVLSGLLVLLMLVVLFVITIIGYHRKKAAFHLKNIGSQISYLDAERERIAADLHDDLGVSLSGIKLRLQCIKTADADTFSIINFSKFQIDEVMQKMRRIAFNMIPDVLLQRGLNQALQELLNIMTEQTGITIDYQYNAPFFDKMKAIHIYRIVQELMNNTLKHGNATAISFNIRKIKNMIQLHFTDNGKGFNTGIVMREGKGFGIKNIMARADLLKAKVYITTAPEKGVDYIIEMPA